MRNVLSLKSVIIPAASTVVCFSRLAWGYYWRHAHCCRTNLVDWPVCGSEVQCESMSDPLCLFTFSVCGRYRLTLINCGSYQQEKMPLAVVGSNVVIEVNGRKVRGRQYPWGVAEGTCRINMTHMSLLWGLYHFSREQGCSSACETSAWACWTICFSGQMSNLRGSGKGRATRWKVFQRERFSS